MDYSHCITVLLTAVVGAVIRAIEKRRDKKKLNQGTGSDKP